LVITAAKGSLSTSPRHMYANTEGQVITSISPTHAPYILLDYATCGDNFVDYLLSLNKSHKSTFGQHFLDIARNYLSTTFSAAKISETSWILCVESDKDLLMLNRRMLEEATDAHILSELPLSTKILPPVRIDPQVSVGENTVIGPNVYLEKGASVGMGSSVSNAIVLSRGIVSANQRVSNAIVTTKGIL
jgi:NDP-sugar pyrophosphorylase family protein